DRSRLSRQLHRRRLRMPCACSRFRERQLRGQRDVRHGDGELCHRDRQYGSPARNCKCDRPRRGAQPAIHGHGASRRAGHHRRAGDLRIDIPRDPPGGPDPNRGIVTISRRQFLKGTGAGCALALVPNLAWAHGPPQAADSVVVRWNAAALQGVRDSKLGPPMVARALAIIHTCAYDAWAAYDHHAIGTRLGGTLRRPPRERTLASKNIAISYAAYRAAVDIFPADKVAVFDPLMRDLGLDPNDTTTNPTTPIGVGNVAANAVLQYRHRDGANQLGDEPGGVPGVPYSDYTGYRSANAPM